MELVFLGVDMSTVGQAQAGKTMVACGVGHEHGLHLTSLAAPKDDLALVKLLRQPFACCGVDAPLGLPPCVLCQELPCPCPYARWMGMLGQVEGASYHYRLSDVLVRLTVPGVLPKPPLSQGGRVDITPLTLRWQRLARQLVGEGAALEKIVEVYASGAIQLYAQAVGLTPRGKVYRYRASAAQREALLVFLGRAGRLTAPDVLWDQLICSEDAFDAAFAALAAWHAHFRAVLLPEMLLGLNSYSRDDLDPLRASDDNVAMDEDERAAMCRSLHKAPWVMLPDVAGFGESFLTEGEPTPFIDQLGRGDS